ncbi:5' nucleotidase, NT5C type [Pedobacter punctiformis]|uniref:5'(3')-deoxyribonucleotidase n=1 Tax=Pedobacter punctiformis TaxID=3004097 RepID=A0ABT4LD56_9SPHI|nr:5'(3')-deoxyribonucleotidase [Pedobacter sp. HCMS5-2]MCZ4245103.1 5'(3')-deoxyribonucleotidase [Pedobacter sp. HCMS5-2]
MKNKKPTIAIDMDGVLADIETQFIDWYHRDYGILISREDMLGKPEPEAFPDKDAVWRFVNTPGFFRTLPVMPNAVAVVKELMNDFDIYIVTAAMEFPLSLFEKYEWLQEHFPFISWKNIVMCGDKSVINTDYLIDDHCKNLDFCKGRAIMFSAAHNSNIDRHERVNTWDEVRALFNEVRNLTEHVV